MALTTQHILSSLVEKFGNDKGEIVGLTQDELVRSIQQIDVTPKSTKSKTKKIRDPNAPKRPTSAYMIWLNESRKSIADDHCSHLIGKAKVTATTRKAGELWREMSDEDKTPYKEKFMVAQQKYVAEKAEYFPSKATHAYDVDHFPEAPEGWSGPFQMRYLSKNVKGVDGKNIQTFKSFLDAVAKANELPLGFCGGITKTARGYQLRVGHDLITNPPEKARTGLASWIKGEPNIPEVGISTETEASNVVKAKKKVSFEKSDDSENQSCAEVPKKRGRGRPKGSTNKPKESSPEPESHSESESESEAPKKRGRGRPKGSKNKSKSKSPEPENQPQPTKDDDADAQKEVSVEEIKLDIGEGIKTYYLDSETKEIYDQQTSEKIGELGEEGKFVAV